MDAYTEALDRIVFAVQHAISAWQITLLPSTAQNVKQVWLQKPNGDQLLPDDIVRIRESIEKYEPARWDDDYTREWQGVALSVSDPKLESTTEYACTRMVDADCSHVSVRTISILGAVHIIGNHA